MLSMIIIWWLPLKRCPRLLLLHLLVYLTDMQVLRV